jgi:pyruvate,orthophosphate dikinase
MTTLASPKHGDKGDVLRKLETRYKDLQDTGNAKRRAQAAVRLAIDAFEEQLLTKAEAVATIDAGSLQPLLHPSFDHEARYRVIAEGVAASPGAAKGTIVFSAADAIEQASAGGAVILVRPFTVADDVAGFHAARGILTSEGGKASHAALVAQGIGRPAVTGAGELEVDLHAGEVRVGDLVLHEGDFIAIDGTSGEITTDDVPLLEASFDDRFETILRWSDELREMDVRANVDTPEEAGRALRFGAEGIGLCRTEHMFMAADRQPKMRAMIMAEGEAGRRAALDELLPLQERDFERLFEAMKGWPVTIRLLDPPLHEFLPACCELHEQLVRARADRSAELALLEAEFERVRSLAEANPMLGTRGVRMGVLHSEIYEMQVRAIAHAARAVESRSGRKPRLEIMVPLVAFEHELELVRSLVISVAEAEGLRYGEDFGVGAMIELPRACLVADRIAAHADFFSFGTNDLTQAGIGLSRDDIEQAVIPRYIDEGIVDGSPFATLDQGGVGELVRIAVERGRGVRPDLELGVCGEHSGDPDSIRFFHNAGLDYVSCPPLRLPIARVAAAQAAIAAPRSGKSARGRR